MFRLEPEDNLQVSVPLRGMGQESKLCNFEYYLQLKLGFRPLAGYGPGKTSLAWVKTLL